MSWKDPENITFHDTGHSGLTINSIVNDQQPQLVYLGFCHVHTLPINLSLCQLPPFFFPLFLSSFVIW